MVISLKEFLNENIVYPILILVKSKKGVLGFTISYLVLKIFRLLIYVN